jgi:hypothetical protein
MTDVDEQADAGGEAEEQTEEQEAKEKVNDPLTRRGSKAPKTSW